MDASKSTACTGQSAVGDQLRRNFLMDTVDSQRDLACDRLNYLFNKASPEGKVEHIRKAKAELEIAEMLLEQVIEMDQDELEDEEIDEEGSGE